MHLAGRTIEEKAIPILHKGAMRREKEDLKQGFSYKYDLF